MLSIRKKLFKNRKGFTLIELIVVIAILAIIAVLAVPRFLGTLDDAKQNTHAANIRSLRSAGNVAIAENGKPAGLVTWESDGTTFADTADDPEFDQTSYVDPNGWPKNPIDSTLLYSVQIEADGDVIVFVGSTAVTN